MPELSDQRPFHPTTNWATSALPSATGVPSKMVVRSWCLEFDAAEQIADRRGQQIGQRGPNDCRCLAGLSLDPEQIVGPLIGLAHDRPTTSRLVRNPRRREQPPRLTDDISASSGRAEQPVDRSRNFRCR